MATLVRTPAHSHVAPAEWLARLRAHLRRAPLERQTYPELSELSDRELDDLRLTRAPLREAARRAVAQT